MGLVVAPKIRQRLCFGVEVGGEGWRVAVRCGEPSMLTGETTGGRRGNQLAYTLSEAGTGGFNARRKGGGRRKGGSEGRAGELLLFLGFSTK